MNIASVVSRILRRSEQKPPGFVVPYGYIGYGGWTRSAWHYDTYVNEGFKANPIVYACLRTISEAAKEVKIVLKKDGEIIDRGDVAETEPVGKLFTLLDRPNPNEAWEEWLTHWIYDILLGGISFVQAINVGTERLGTYTRAKNGRLYLLRPDWVQIISEGHEVISYKYKDILYPPEEILTLKLCDPVDEFGGHSPLKSAATVTDCHNQASLWNKNILSNAGGMLGLLLVKGLVNLSQAKKDEWKANFQNEIAGAKKAGGTLVLPGEGQEYKQLATSPKELDWLGGKSDAMRDIATAFLVPTELLGDPAASTYNNVKEASKALYTTNVVPLMRHLTGELTNWLSPKYLVEGESSYKLEIGIDTTDIDALKQDETEKTTRTNLSDWLTINEKRTAFGLDEVPTSEEYPTDIPVFFLKNAAPGGFTIAPMDEPTSTTAPVRSRAIVDRLPHVHDKTLYPTEESRRFNWKKKDNKIRKWDAIIDRASRKLLVNAARYVADRIEDENRSNGEHETRVVNRVRVDEMLSDAGLQTDIFDEFTTLESALILEFGEAALAEAKASGLIYDLQRPAIQRFLGEGLSDRSRIITDTTAQQLVDIINAGVESGEGALKIADRIRESYPDMAASRARTIARTETNMGSNTATLEAYKQAQVEQKEWLSARDERVRETHMDMDGQVVGMEEDFVSPSGARGISPGAFDDPAESINCRCVMVPLMEGESPI